MASERFNIAIDPESAYALNTKRRVAGYSTIQDYVRELIMKDLSASPEHATISAARTAALNETRQWLLRKVHGFFVEIAEKMKQGSA